MGLIRQISIGTMGMLRLPSPFSFPSVPLGLDTIYGIAFFFAMSGGNTYQTYRDSILRGLPL